MDVQNWVRRVLLGEHSFRFLVELLDQVDVERFRDVCAGRQWRTRSLDHDGLDRESPIVEVELSSVGMRDAARDLAARRIRAAFAATGVRGRLVAADESAADTDAGHAARASRALIACGRGSLLALLGCVADSGRRTLG
ncbi:hypothetical protein AB0L13_36905 [Saccharopolyspora shandongensis]|uniref:hypothetical protein n=1 Tax=Saccharopolyspora shandongensis TaxID=418495 RepID=UPI003412227B